MLSVTAFFFSFCQMDGGLFTSSTVKKGLMHVQYAAPHTLLSVHTDEKELHTGHDHSELWNIIYYKTSICRVRVRGKAHVCTALRISEF